MIIVHTPGALPNNQNLFIINQVNLELQEGDFCKHLPHINQDVDVLVLRSTQMDFPLNFLQVFLKYAITCNTYVYSDLTYCGHPEMTMEFFPQELVKSLQSKTNVFLPNGNVDMQYCGSVKTYQFDDHLLADFVHHHQDDYQYPRGINIEPSALCNLRCTMCNYQVKLAPKSIRPPYMMPLDTFRLLAEEMAVWPLKPAIEFSFRGEGLMNNNIFAGISHFAAIGCYTVLFSNGLLLTRDVFKRIMDAGLSSLYFSIDALEKDVYESIRIGSSFNSVIKNLNEVIEYNYNSSNPLYIGIRMIRMEENKQYWDQVFKLYENIVDSVSLQNHVYFDFDQQKYLCNNMFCETDRIRHFCILPWQNMMIASNGDVYVCGATDTTREDEVMGNFHANSLFDIWHSPKMTELRSQMLALKVSSPYQCARCSRQPCSGGLVWQTLRGTIFERIFDSVKYTTRNNPVAHEAITDVPPINKMKQIKEKIINLFR